jgi:hypothetical protein
MMGGTAPSAVPSEQLSVLQALFDLIALIMPLLPLEEGTGVVEALKAIRVEIAAGELATPPEAFIAGPSRSPPQPGSVEWEQQQKAVFRG